MQQLNDIYEERYFDLKESGYELRITGTNVSQPGPCFIHQSAISTEITGQFENVLEMKCALL